MLCSTQLPAATSQVESAGVSLRSRSGSTARVAGMRASATALSSLVILVIAAGLAGPPLRAATVARSVGRPSCAAAAVSSSLLQIHNDASMPAAGRQRLARKEIALILQNSNNHARCKNEMQIQSVVISCKH